MTTPKLTPEDVIEKCASALARDERYPLNRYIFSDVKDALRPIINEYAAQQQGEHERVLAVLRQAAPFINRVAATKELNDAIDALLDTDKEKGNE